MNATYPTLIGTEAQRIAFGTTQHEGDRKRWTEISVYYLHQPGPGGKRWVSETTGKSLVEGETDRTNRLYSGTLERALKLVKITGPVGVEVAETAREWADDNRVVIENDRGGLLSFDDDTKALNWLYGQPDEGHTGYATMLERDLGAGSSTVRMQIKARRPVMVPLRSLLPFIDRGAFRRARAAAGES